jgi:hypothetical protein
MPSLDVGIEIDGPRLDSVAPDFPESHVVAQDDHGDPHPVQDHRNPPKVARASAGDQYPKGYAGRHKGEETDEHDKQPDPVSIASIAPQIYELVPTSQADLLIGLIVV